MRLRDRAIHYIENRTIYEIYRNTRLQLQIDATRSTTEFIKANLRSVNSVRWPRDVINMAIKNVKVKNGLFLEFGVYKGSSLNFIAKKINNETIYGFDSFEGLPTFWMDGFGIGTFKTDYQKLKFRSNVKIVKGLFQETLPKFKVEHTQPISFVHIDSDLYESAKFVLTSLKDQIVSGTVIVFDDFFNYSGWQDGEFRAFKEFLDITKINFRYTIYCYKGDNVAVEII